MNNAFFITFFIYSIDRYSVYAERVTMFRQNNRSNEKKFTKFICIGPNGRRDQFSGPIDQGQRYCL